MILEEFREFSPFIEFATKRVPRNGFRDGSLKEVSGILHCPVNWFWPYDKMVLKTTLISNPAAGVDLPGGAMGFGCRIDCREDGDRYELISSSDVDG